MKKKWIMIGALGFVVIAIGLSMVGLIMSQVEHPNYKVIAVVDTIEVREYQPMIIAEVRVHGERKQAISEGFRLLADYIFGNNRVQQEIAMTAPVQQQASEKIAMTAPVQQQEEAGSWKVNFVMPTKYRIDTIPKPNNDRVKLHTLPTKQFVVITFSGSNSNANIAQHEKLLMDYVDNNAIQTVGSPKYAFYNPPWTLPFMRRNEIMLELIDKNPTEKKAKK